MIVEIESYLGDYYLFGNTMTCSELGKEVAILLNEVPEKDFTSVFCSRCNFEKLESNKKIIADYVIDLDTHKLYKPC